MSRMCAHHKAPWEECRACHRTISDLESALSAAQRERDVRHELLVDIARDLDLLGRDLTLIPFAVRSALSAAREEARRLERENESCGLVINDCTARLAASESSARRLREALEGAATTLERIADDKCGEGRFKAARVGASAARAALGSSPVAPSSREGGDEG